MEKKTYIAPIVAIHQIKMAANLLLSASGDGKGLLGNGGTTKGNVTVSDARDNAWDIWGTGDDFED